MNNNKNSILAFVIALILIIGWSLELKAIYWASLDLGLLFNARNILSICSYLLIHLFLFMVLIGEAFNPNWGKEIFAWFKRNHLASAILALFCFISPIHIFAFSDWGLVFSAGLIRAIFLVADILMLAFCMGSLYKVKNPFIIILIALILVGTAFAFAYRFKRIIDYPFSLSWSEGNRFWDYSVLFGSERYDYTGTGEIFALIDFGRQSLWGSIFLLPNVTIQIMRLWNDLLYILPSILLGWMLFKEKENSLFYTLLAGFGVFLFLNQGPIYTPIIIALILVITIRKLPLIPGLIVTILAGYYAQLTRYTWSVAPALWAGLIVLLDTEKDNLSSSKRLKRIIQYILSGLIGGILLPIFFPIQKGIYKPPEGTSLTIIDRIIATISSQDLIWARLLPNNTNPLGILLSILFATLPTIFFIFYAARDRIQNMSRWEKTVIYLSLIATFVVGVIVSTKIGGGSNLHNFDLFFLTIVLLAGLFRDELARTFRESVPKQQNLLYSLLIFATLVSFRNDLLYTSPLQIASTSTQTYVLEEIQNEIDSRKNHGEILFIDQRQLLTFNYIQAPLVVDYEKKMLMNEALSQDEDYFSSFYKDLQNHRFSLIINEPINITYQENEASYGEENDAYVKWISEPLLCYYEPLITYQEVGVELLVPRTSPVPDHLNCP